MLDSGLVWLGGLLMIALCLIGALALRGGEDDD